MTCFELRVVAVSSDFASPWASSSRFDRRKAFDREPRRRSSCLWVHSAVSHLQYIQAFERWCGPLFRQATLSEEHDSCIGLGAIFGCFRASCSFSVAAALTWITVVAADWKPRLSDLSLHFSAANEHEMMHTLAVHDRAYVVLSLVGLAGRYLEHPWSYWWCWNYCWSRCRWT